MNIQDTALRDLLQRCKTIAVVGLSAQPDRPSYRVAQYMQAQSYTIVPVNPGLTQWQGLTCYPDLPSIPFAVDMVDVFRKSQDCAPIAQAAVAMGARALWLQLGVVNEQARETAEAAGLTVVMDRCLKIEHARLLGA